MKSLSLLKDFWFEELGCAVGDLQPNHVSVVSHGTLKGYRGVMFFKHDSACIISAPEEMVPSLKKGVLTLDTETCFHISMVSTLIGEKLDRIVGPAWIGQIDSGTYRKQHAEETRLILEDEWESLAELLRSCNEDEAAHSALEVGRSPTVGIFTEKKLVAAAGYEVLNDKVAHIGVLTHPDYRGRGLAVKVVSGITELALESELGIQYRTLYSNTSSVKAGKKVGFNNFAETIAARLK